MACPCEWTKEGLTLRRMDGFSLRLQKPLLAYLVIFHPMSTCLAHHRPAGKSAKKEATSSAVL